MSCFKSISDLLYANKQKLAEEDLNLIIEYQLNENSMTKVRDFLNQDKDDILDQLDNSIFGDKFISAVSNKNSEDALKYFTSFVGYKTGTNLKLFKKWKKNKEFIEWFDDNIANRLDMPPVPAAQSFWTKFDPDNIGTEFQNIAGGDNSSTEGNRNDMYGEIGDADSIGNIDGVDIDDIGNKTDVRNRDAGSDKELTDPVDIDGGTKALRAQNVGDTLSNKVDRKNKAAQDLKTKYPNTSGVRPGKTQNLKAGGYNDRGNQGTRSPNYTRKNNDTDEQYAAMRMNAAKANGDLPEYATRSLSNFLDYEKQNGEYGA